MCHIVSSILFETCIKNTINLSFHLHQHQLHPYFLLLQGFLRFQFYEQLSTPKFRMILKLVGLIWSLHHGIYHGYVHHWPLWSNLHVSIQNCLLLTWVLPKKKKSNWNWKNWFHGTFPKGSTMFIVYVLAEIRYQRGKWLCP